MPTEIERIRLLKRRDSAIEQLRTLGNLTRGSLYTTTVRCGRAGCECEKGLKHPKLHLSIRMKGRTRNVYVGQKRAEEVEALLAEYRRAWRLIEELTEVNLELLRPTRNRSAGKEVKP